MVSVGILPYDDPAVTRDRGRGKMPTTLVNGTVANLSPPQLFQSDLTIEAGRIASRRGETSGPGETVDCSGCLVVPGNVCAHTHTYSALARGMPAPPKAPKDFREILEYVWWRLDRALDEPAVRYSGLIGALDAVRCGTTTLVDHHASPSYIEGSLDTLADAFGEVGIRGVVCYEVTDRNGMAGRDAGLRETDRFLRENSRDLIRGMVGAHASFTLADETLSHLASLASQHRVGVHIHVAEDECDEQDSLHRCGERVAHRLVRAGIFDENSIAAHGVHLDDGEIEKLRSKNAWFVHNCRSNMNNRVGRAPVTRFGNRVALGTDGIDENMFAESRAAFFRGHEAEEQFSAEQVAAMMAVSGSLVSQFFAEPVGVLTEGAAADLLVLEYDPPTPLTPGNLAWHWMFAFTAAAVRDVMIGGKWVMRNRVFCAVDEEKVRAEARSEATKVWKRMSEL